MQEYFFGLNVVKNVMKMGFEDYDSDHLDCVSYNVNLDYVCDLIEEYGVNINIYSNSENMTFNVGNKFRILSFYDEGKIKFFHVSENIGIIHAKIYRFIKDGKLSFLAIGSPNFTRSSNNNIESVVIITDKKFSDDIWGNVVSTHTIFNVNLNESLPDSLEEKIELDFNFDTNLLTNLWLHQKQILQWMANKPNSIINIPPGTGKTRIALKYIEHIFNNDEFITVLILVPTTALVNQWLGILKDEGHICYEMKNNFNNLISYFPNPNRKIIVTLYSRFNVLYEHLYQRYRIIRPNLMIIHDECHTAYGNIDIHKDFIKRINRYNGNIYKIGLSATLDTFNIFEMKRYIDYMGGEKNRFDISLPSFYSKWNDENDRPILKPIKYIPLKYCLSKEEYKKYMEYGSKIAAQMSITNIENESIATAAIQRAMWLRSLNGGINVLKNYIITHMEIFKEKSTLIFVQTNEIAKKIQKLITTQPAWNRNASMYIYDSSKPHSYREYALEEFKGSLGFCLISERMLAEGFDLPKIDSIILHGSHRSERDWIQKVGRGIRFNPDDPSSIATVIDVVFCDELGDPLPLEIERYEVLSSISR